MDPAITESPTRGYYVVYLFSANMRRVYLSLNQGMTAVKKEFGSSYPVRRETTWALAKDRIGPVRPNCYDN